MSQELKDLLSTEKWGLDSLTSAVESEYDHLIRELREAEDDYDKLRASRRSTKRLLLVLALIIYALRRKARDKARSQRKREVGIFRKKNRSALDRLKAEAAARSLANTWSSLIVSKLDEESGIDASILTSMNKKIRMIATTETSQAWNDELRSHTFNFDGFKRWDATLDAKTCRICRAHDGEEVPVDSEFSSGHIPGFVHPNCRCLITLISLKTKKAA